MSVGPGSHRIGEFSRRVGVSPELLRAWERRYGLLRPVRSPGGFRLYGEEDAERVARMRVALDAGHSAAEAARVALGPVLPSAGSLRDQALERLLEAVRGYDESAVHTTIDEAMAAFGLEAVLEDLLLPVLVEVGSRWERGELTISQEHFASNLIRGRMLSLARLWGRGSGPLAVLACVAGEPHDIGLLAFGLVLRSYGWRILFLGGDTPTSTLSDTSRSIGPQAVVVSSFDRGRLESEAPGLRHLARSVPVVVAGPGATEALAKRIRARRLDGSVVSAARDLAGVEAG